MYGGKITALVEISAKPVVNCRLFLSQDGEKVGCTGTELREGSMSPDMQIQVMIFNVIRKVLLRIPFPIVHIHLGFDPMDKYREETRTIHPHRVLCDFSEINRLSSKPSDQLFGFPFHRSHLFTMSSALSGFPYITYATA